MLFQDGLVLTQVNNFFRRLLDAEVFCDVTDNITPPLAACLGDLLTLFILSLLGTALVGAMDTIIPLLAVIIMSIAAGWFTRRVVRNVWVKEVAKGGWVPLVSKSFCNSGSSSHG